MRFLLAVAVSIFISSFAFAVSPKELLLGSWYFKRGIGRPCDTLILALEYHFRKDGSYSTWTRMKGGYEQRYDGTYVATDTSATATVNGQKIGPFPYSIKDDVLRINQPDYRCDVELSRE